MCSKFFILMAILLILPIQSQVNKLINIKFQQVPSNPQQAGIKNSKTMTMAQLIETIYRNPQSLLQLKNVYIQSWPTPVQQNANKINKAVIQNKNKLQDNLPQNSIAPTKTISPTVGSSAQAKAPNQQNQVLSSIKNANIQTIASNANLGQKNTISKLSVPTATIANSAISTTRTPNLISTVPSSSPTAASNQSEPPLTAPIQTLRQYMISLTNGLRKKHNVKEVTYNSLLTKIAQDHSNDMAARNFFDHANPDGQRVGDRAAKNNFFGSIGENLAFAPTLNKAQIGFQNSPTHFANAIKNNWENIGVGIAIKGPMMYVTVLFSPKDISRDKLSNNDIQNIKTQLSNAIKIQSANLKTYDTVLSQYIQEYLQSNRGTSLMSYVVSRGRYRTPMTAATYTMDYTNDLVDRAIEKKYFENQENGFTKFGIGIVQKSSKLEINIIYM